MEEKKEKKTIKCSYAVLVIILFATVCFLTDYIIIERKTRQCDCPKCETTNNEVISDNTDNTQVTEDKTDDDNTNDISFCYKSNLCNGVLVNLLGQNNVFDSDSNVRTTSDKISLVRFSKYADVDVVDGNLLFKVHKYTIDESTANIVIDDNYNETFTYNIPDESIKYIFCLYYQPGGNTRIYVLTDSNNLYLSEYNHIIKENEFEFNSIINFKKINSDVVDMRLLDNPNYGEGNDSLSKSLYAVKDDELVRLF